MGKKKKKKWFRVFVIQYAQSYYLLKNHCFTLKSEIEFRYLLYHFRCIQEEQDADSHNLFIKHYKNTTL